MPTIPAVLDLEASRRFWREALDAAELRGDAACCELALPGGASVGFDRRVPATVRS